MRNFSYKNVCTRMLALLLIVAPLLLGSSHSNALSLDNRSITVGTSLPNSITTHRFNFNVMTPGALGSIELEYCTNSPLVGNPCTVPAGLDLTGASLTAQSGETGFSIDPSSTANRVVLTRPVAAASAHAVMYMFGSVTNPSTPAQTVFVRISTYASIDATGSRTDDGGVAFSTSGSLGIGGFVPPFLKLCVGVTVASDCSSTVGSSIDMGELSPESPNTATSQFAVATNDFQGYVAYVLGTTMTSGNNVLPAMAVPSVSTVGLSQFGINLRANTNPVTGLNPSAVGTGVPTASYNIPNNFTFIPGDSIAVSTLPSDYTVFSISYLANVSANQHPGVYSTTMTYMAVVQF